MIHFEGFMVSWSNALSSFNITTLKKLHVTIIFYWLVLYSFPITLYADNETDLSEMSIEELMTRKVVTASRTEQNLSDTASAVFIISQNDIRRSGVDSIPGALRLVPGLHVAKIDSSKWAITSRGFNGRFANNLLVLIDGRTLSSSNSAGVFWENQDRVLEDIERIEVIRGPGASVWGANAVNGIINIITKNSTDTQGSMVSLLGGDRNGISVRQGWQYTDQGAARVYAKFFHQDGLIDEKGNDAKDDWNMFRGGFRLDWVANSQHTFMLQGDAYGGRIEQRLNLPSITSLSAINSVFDTVDTQGGNLLARWEYSQSLASRLSTQLYYDNFRRHGLTNNERHDTFGFDFQHEIALNQNNEFTWGMGYRFSVSEFVDSEFVRISPNNHDLHLASAFLHDKLAFFNQRLELSVGSKFEYHSFSGFEYLPTIRMLWKINAHQRVWAAASRSTRVPNIAERHAEIPFAAIPQTQNFVVLQGSTDFDPETVISYELGYRFWSSDRFSFDLAAFYNKYDDLIFTELAAPTAAGNIPLKIINGEKATTWGAEITVNWHPFDWAQFQLSGSYLKMNFDQFQSSALSTGNFPSNDKRDPEFQFSFRSLFDLTPSVEFDFWLRYVDAIPDIEVINANQHPSIKSYVAMDVRIGWQLHKEFQLAIGARNLNDPQHLEYLSEIATFPEQVQRNYYVQAKWIF